MNYDKILFLDIDGVLNCKLYNSEHIALFIQNEINFENPTKEEIRFESRCVELFKKLNNPSIVISSNWRKLFKDTNSALLFFQKVFKLYEIPFEIVGVTEVVPPPKLSLFQDKSNAIKKWIVDNKVTNFVILDDLSLYDKHLNKFLVQTTFDYGLEAKHIQQVNTILDGTGIILDLSTILDASKMITSTKVGYVFKRILNLLKSYKYVYIRSETPLVVEGKFIYKLYLKIYENGLEHNVKFTKNFNL